ncbi:hypothetical protein [Nocardia sp. IFM 10818]
MNGRTLSRRVASVAAVAASAALLGATTAAAEPAEPAKSPLEIATEQLTAAAGENAEAKAAVETTVKGAQLISAAKLSNIAWTPFGYQAPTIGCGSNMPFTMTVASATVSPDPAITVPPGMLRFQATPAHSGMPLASGLSVVWLNVANGRSGINGLDELTEYGLPALAKTVDSGPGTVIATLWGSIDYPAARCAVLPTVGLFTVPEPPKDPAVAPPVDSGSGTGSGTPAN